MKRKPIEIKKDILNILKKEQNISIKKLERKINTNYQTILNNCEELEYFGFVKINKTHENSVNGRDYLVVTLNAKSANLF
jgi:predicted transcriptional regulator